MRIYRSMDTFEFANNNVYVDSFTQLFIFEILDILG